MGKKIDKINGEDNEEIYESKINSYRKERNKSSKHFQSDSEIDFERNDMR